MDGNDACPNTPKGAKVDAKGCPSDADGDGVFDGLDRFPGTPGGAQVDGGGCPRDTDADGVFDGLDKVAESLRDWPEVRVEIGGHTDNSGADAYNMALSQKRAESVRAHLIGKGVDGERLTAKGYGETAPVADNATKEGKAKNRRVEVTRLD